MAFRFPVSIVSLLDIRLFYTFDAYHCVIIYRIISTYFAKTRAEAYSSSNADLGVGPRWEFGNSFSVIHP